MSGLEVNVLLVCPSLVLPHTLFVALPAYKIKKEDNDYMIDVLKRF